MRDIRLEKAMAVAKILLKYTHPIAQADGVYASELAKKIVEEVEELEIGYLNDKHEAFLETMSGESSE